MTKRENVPVAQPEREANLSGVPTGVQPPDGAEVFKT
jgi:hypothetical protein